MTVSTDPRKTGINAGMSLLAASAVAVPNTGSTTENALATVTIPAGAMGLNGGLEIRTVWSYTNSANAKTLLVRFGGTGGAAFMLSTQTTTASYSDVRRFRNRNSLTSQIGGTNGTNGGLGSSTGSVIASAINTAVDVNLVIAAQLANAAETITLESYEVWLLP